MKWRICVLFLILAVRLVWGWGEKAEQLHQDKILDGFRYRLVDVAQRNLPVDEGALVLGVTLGYKSQLSRSFYDQLINSGTVHMVVASGYNVMVVASLMTSLALLFFPRKMATALAILGLSFYVVLSGGEVSLVRAALMGSTALIGLAFGRGTRAWWSLLLVVWGMLFWSPALVEDVSFQLSVAATFGVMVVGPWIRNAWEKTGSSLLVMAEKIDLVSTLSALLMTMPIIVFHFGRVAWVSILSNSFVLPLIPVLMALGGVMLALGLVSSTLALIVSWPTYALAHLIVVLVGVFGGGQ